MKAEAVAHGVEQAPNDTFGACVPTLDGLHDAPPLLGAAGIHLAVPTVPLVPPDNLSSKILADEDADQEAVILGRCKAVHAFLHDDPAAIEVLPR